MELEHYLNVFRRWIWVLILATVGTGAVAYLAIQNQPPEFVSEVRLLVGPGVDTPAPDLNALRTSGQIMQTYAQLATTRDVLQAVNDKLELGMGHGKLKSKISVKADAETQFLTISVTDNYAERAAAIANGVAHEITRISAASRIGQIGQNEEEVLKQTEKQKEIIGIAESRIKKLEADLENLIDPQTQKLMTAQETLIAKLQADLQAPINTEQQREIDATKERIAKLEVGLGAATDLDARRVILDQLAFEHSRAEDLLDRELQNRQVTLDLLAQARTHYNTLKQAITDKRNMILDMLAAERSRISDAERMLNSLFPLLKTTATNRVKIIETALPGSPETREPFLNVVMAAMAGLIVAYSIALVYENLDDTVKTVNDLTKQFPLPVLASITSWQNSKLRGPEDLAILAAPQSAAADSYRLMAARLLLLGGDKRLRSVLLSSLTKEGDTSEAAANLSVRLSELGKKVALIDANFRGSGISRIFRVNSPSLADVLEGIPSKPSKIDWASGLSILPSGSCRLNPSEILTSLNMRELIERLSGEADLVIISAPPLVSSADSLILAQWADGVVLFAQQGETRRLQINKAIADLQLVGSQVVGLVFNQHHFMRFLRIKTFRKANPKLKLIDAQRAPRSKGPMREALP